MYKTIDNKSWKAQCKQTSLYWKFWFHLHSLKEVNVKQNFVSEVKNTTTPLLLVVVVDMLMLFAWLLEIK